MSYVVRRKKSGSLSFGEPHKTSAMETTFFSKLSNFFKNFFQKFLGSKAGTVQVIVKQQGPFLKYLLKI